MKKKKKVYHAPFMTVGPPDFTVVPKAVIGCYPWAEEGGYKPYAYGQVAHDEAYLYMRLSCREKNPLITCTFPNQMVCRDSCLEFFINPLPGMDTFLNIETNAAGIMLIGLYKEGDFKLIDPDCQNLFGKVAEIDAKSGYWRVSYRLPFDFFHRVFAISGQFPHEVEVNFYKCGDYTPAPHYGSWNMIVSEKPDFFRSEYFGKLILHRKLYTQGSHF